MKELVAATREILRKAPPKKQTPPILIPAIGEPGDSLRPPAKTRNQSGGKGVWDVMPPVFTLLRPRLAALMLLPLSLSAAPEPASSGARPNIVFIFSDDHAAQALGAYGSRFGDDVTPRLDRMAKEGVTVENCACGNPLCGPSRAIVLTGKFSNANRFFSNEYSPVFDGAQQTLPKLMHAAGYQSAMIGKWHLGGKPVGFDHYEILNGHGTYYAPDLITAEGVKKNPGAYVTDLLTDRAIAWMDKGRDPAKPFLLMLHHKAPHRNWLPGPGEMALFKNRDWPEPAGLRDDYAGRSPAPAEANMRIGDNMYFANDLLVKPDPKEFMASGLSGYFSQMTPAQRALFDASYGAENAAFLKNPPTGDALLKWKYQRYMTDYLRCVAGVDKSVGRVLDYLKARGLDKNTVVIYSSDQGFFLGEHGFYDKRFAYEESLRMPFIASWPGHFKAGSRATGLMQNTDFLPTFLDLAGAPVPADVHGISALPILTGEKTELHDATYTHFYEDTIEHHAAAYVAVRTQHRKLINYYDRGVVEMFDLDKDSKEMLSVADDPAYAAERKALEKRLAELAAQYGDKTGPWGDDRGGAVPKKLRVKPGQKMPLPALSIHAAGDVTP